ncbi:MAG: hypothetical protein D4R48_05105 [Nitrosomonadales bacterium]|nr:MAG: hypothetical protein D4R48_05105 [Nitrosomonadales bacterium]
MTKPVAVLSFLCLLCTHAALAEEDLLIDPRVSIRTVEPAREVGYTVGDILERTITLEAKKPYKLLETSLPIVGYERRYKGQVTGIELRRIHLEQSPGTDATTYTLHLAYQVFTNNIVAKPAMLPPEIVKFSGAGKMFEYRIPSWSFRISPLAVYGSVKIEKDMSPFRGPLLLDASAEKLRLKVLLALFGVSLLGLLYVLGANTWLPRMGGPFARACRDLRKLPATDEGLQQAVTRVHQALNASAGNTVFGGNLEAFLLDRPAFIPLRADIERFFGLSRQVFFEPAAAHDIGATPLVWLRQFGRRCRDCERGLK